MRFCRLQSSSLDAQKYSITCGGGDQVKWDTNIALLRVVKKIQSEHGVIKRDIGHSKS